jgi:hypothetical protein
MRDFLVQRGIEGGVAIGSVPHERNVMHSRGGHVVVLLALCLAVLAMVGSSMHAHPIDHAGNSSCTGCVLGLSPVDVIDASDSAAPDFGSSPVVTPTCVVPRGLTTDRRLSRGPPLRPTPTRQS